MRGPPARAGPAIELLPQTTAVSGVASWLGRSDFGVNRKRDLLNPAKNLEAGVKYLKWLTERFGGDMQKTLAASAAPGGPT